METSLHCFIASLPHFSLLFECSNYRNKKFLQGHMAFTQYFFRLCVIKACIGGLCAIKACLMGLCRLEVVHTRTMSTTGCVGEACFSFFFSYIYIYRK